MNTKSTVLDAILSAKRAGYLQVSLVSLANKTGLPKRAVCASLRKAGFDMPKRDGEAFVNLLETPQLVPVQLQMCELPKPQSEIMRDIMREAIK